MHDYGVIKLTDLFGPGLPELTRVWSVMAAHGKPIRPKEIVEATGLSKQNVGRALRRLKSLGYVKLVGKIGRSTWLCALVQFAPDGAKPVIIPPDVLRG